jgi:hypothetical protein
MPGGVATLWLRNRVDDWPADAWLTDNERRGRRCVLGKMISLGKESELFITRRRLLIGVPIAVLTCEVPRARAVVALTADADTVTADTIAITADRE